MSGLVLLYKAEPVVDVRVEIGDGVLAQSRLTSNAYARPYQKCRHST